MHAPHDVLYVYSGHDLSDADRCVQSDSHELNIYPPVSPSPRLPVSPSPRTMFTRFAIDLQLRQRLQLVQLVPGSAGGALYVVPLRVRC